MGQKMMELEPWDTDGLCDLKKREAIEVSIAVTVNKSTPETMVKAAPAPDLHVWITETMYLPATTKGRSSQVASSSFLGTFFSGNSSVWPVMQNKFHGDQLKGKLPLWI